MGPRTLLVLLPLLAAAQPPEAGAGMPADGPCGSGESEWLGRGELQREEPAPNNGRSQEDCSSLLQSGSRLGMGLARQEGLEKPEGLEPEQPETETEMHRVEDKSHEEEARKHKKDKKQAEKGHKKHEEDKKGTTEEPKLNPGKGQEGPEKPDGLEPEGHEPEALEPEAHEPEGPEPEGPEPEEHEPEELEPEELEPEEPEPEEHEPEEPEQEELEPKEPEDGTAGRGYFKFESVDGARGRRCQGEGSSARPGPLSRHECKWLCKATEGCSGVEFESGSGQCVIFTGTIQATQGAAGWECYRLVHVLN